MTVKEAFDLTGAPTNWGNPKWRDNIATRDSEVLKRLRDAEAILALPFRTRHIFAVFWP